MAEERQCGLVIVGIDEYGHKELLAMIDGLRESAESCRELLLDLRRRGLKQDPKLAIGDGALRFWTAAHARSLPPCVNMRLGCSPVGPHRLSSWKPVGEGRSSVSPWPRTGWPLLVLAV